MAARKETKDLMWKSEHMGHYLVFLDRLEKSGEGALGPSSAIANDAPVAMDVDPPAKRQRTGDYSSIFILPSATSAGVNYSKIPLGKQQPSSSSPSTPRLTAAVPASSSSTTHAPTSASPNPPSTPTSKSLAALESMLTTLASRPSPKIDHLAAVRAALSLLSRVASSSSSRFRSPTRDHIRCRLDRQWW